MRLRVALVCLAFVPLGLACSADAPAALAQPAVETQHWAGEMTMLDGSKLAFELTLERGAGGWSGRVSVPAQAILGLPASELEVAEDQLSFVLRLPGVPEMVWPTVRLAIDGRRADGALAQGGVELPIGLDRLTKAQLEERRLARRPQHPREPYPYRVVDVAVGSVDGVVLGGTLTLPDRDQHGDGPYPGAVLVSGSGPQDRDSTVLGHKPFLVLADHLTRRGIAVLRYDDRGVHGSTGDFPSSTSLDFADDALAAVAFLRARAEVAADAVGLIGHSEGGLIVAVAASRSEDVAYVVSLAGTGVPGAEVLIAQSAELLRQVGMPESHVARSTELRTAFLDLAETDAGHDELLEAALALVRYDATVVLDDETATTAAEGLVRLHVSDWMKTFCTVDPGDYYRQITVPVLALNGELDMQVLPDQNLPAIERALAHNADATTMSLDRLNHLFQTATTGGLDEYGVITETFNAGALGVVSAWVLERFGD